MKEIEVRTQAELDRALEKIGDEDLIVLVGNGQFIVGSGSPRMVARESSSPRMVARGSSSPRMVARGSSSPRMEARESSSPRMVARESSSPSMEAWESSSPRMEARGSSSVTGSIGKYAGAIARLYDNAALNVPGAVILKKPAIKTATDWCEFYGVTPKRGVVVLFKAVDDDYSTDNARRRSIFYTPGSKPAAPDWDGGVAECGGGLHFSPHPLMALDFNEGAKRFVGCPVKLSEIVVHEGAAHPSKVKAPRVFGAVFEVDRRGEPLAARR